MQLNDDQVTTAEVKGWRGLHLLHFQASSCSQKVRILLAEKGLAWESHPVDLARKENIRPWFLGINPRGVVPVLVHDGSVHVESNDIMEYLDTRIASPATPLFPRSDAEAESARRSLALEDELHSDLRNVTLGFLLPAALARKSATDLDRFANSGAPDPRRDEEVRWHRDFARQGVTAEQARASFAAFARAFTDLDARLASSPWLLGDRLSLLEIAWFINVHRLARAGYPLARHPHLAAWYGRLLERPAFANEAGADTAGAAGVVLALYQAWRRLTRTTLLATVEG
jgi:glutathione S-transferase